MNDEKPRKFSAEAIAVFRRMQVLEDQCACEEVDEECEACRNYWDEHSVLHNLLKLKAWEWPAIEHPDAECARGTDPVHEARQRYRELEKAALGSQA